MRESICEIVRNVETNYLNGSVQIGEYVDWDMHDTIEKIDAYLNSRHTSGPKDSLGRDKPFFNIVSAAVNIWYRATDLDRKNIRIMPDAKKHVGMAFIANVILQNWMKESRFGVFLNDWGRALARYGSAVVKFVQRDGQLIASVVPWNRIICDPIDFDASPRIEKLYKTPAQLRAHKYYDQEVVETLISAQGSTRQTLDGQNQDQLSNFIEIYEVHGELPEYLLEEDPDNAEDTATYRQQMHVVSFVQVEKGEYKDFTLFRGKEKKDPYMLTHLIKEDGRTLSIGAVEYLFDAQWMKNHTVKNMKDTLDLASKLIFQTPDTSYIGRNVLSAIETGDIMIHKANMPLTQINNSKADIVAFQNFGNEWERLSQTLTSTPDAIRGDTLPSGTPYSLAAYQGAQANSLFEIMTENKGLDIEDMMRIHILPFIKTKMDTKEEITAILDADGIAEIDALFIPAEAIRRHNKAFKESILQGSVPSPFQPDMAEEQIRKELAPLGNKRFFTPDDLNEKTWKEALDGFVMTCVVEVTNENTDKQAVLQTLSTVLQTVASNPAILQDANARLIFNQILSETGKISPIQLSSASAQRPPVGPPSEVPEISAPTGETLPNK